MAGGNRGHLNLTVLMKVFKDGVVFVPNGYVELSLDLAIFQNPKAAKPTRHISFTKSNKSTQQT